MARFVLVLRIALGLVFVYAAYTKLKQPSMLFAMSIDAYQLLPSWAVVVVAETLPWFELLLGLMLIAGILVRYASAATALLMCGFLIIMALSYGKGMAIDCGCFGVGEALTAWSLARDGALALAAVALTVLSFRKPKVVTAPQFRV